MLSSSLVLKGIAIFLVLLCHFAGFYSRGGIRLFTPAGGIGVAIFLILSGYGLNESWKRNHGKGWWRKRLLKVFLPYAIIQWGGYWLWRPFDFWGFLKDVTCICPLYVHGWYMHHLMICYVSFPPALSMIGGMKNFKLLEKQKICHLFQARH